MEIIYETQLDRHKEKKIVCTRIYARHDSKHQLQFRFHHIESEIDGFYKAQKNRSDRQREALRKIKQTKYDNQQQFYCMVYRLYNYFDLVCKRFQHNKKQITAENFTHILYTLLSGFILGLKQQDKDTYNREIECIRERYINNKDKNHARILAELVSYVITIQQQKYLRLLEALRNVEQRNSELGTTLFVTKKIRIEKNQREERKSLNIATISRSNLLEPQNKQNEPNLNTMKNISMRNLFTQFTFVIKKKQPIKSLKDYNKQILGSDKKIQNKNFNKLDKVQSPLFSRISKSPQQPLISRIPKSPSPLYIIQDLDIQKYQRMCRDIKKSKAHIQKIFMDLRARNNIRNYRQIDLHS